MIMFLRGQVTTTDGTPLPNDVMVERVCGSQTRQQVHASPAGQFSMQLGSRNDAMLDATGEASRSETSSKNEGLGIPRQALLNCELRASVSGFTSSLIYLANLSGSMSSVDVGAIVVQRGTKAAGSTVSASAYRAPPRAINAYEKGMEAQRKGKSADARKHFEKAVEIYPAYANAWFQLGTALQKEQQKDAARTAFTKAAESDSRFLPPYVALALMAFEAENWTEVLSFTDHVLDNDPMHHMPGYVLDLDSSSYTDASFYNAVANFKLNKFAEAEKSGLRTAHTDLLTRFPQVHLLLSEIFTRRKDYDSAIIEVRTFLELAPRGKDAEQVRERLAQLEKLNVSASTGGKSPT
jgi:tetratricopeptide (TPR) repeat protein